MSSPDHRDRAPEFVPSSVYYEELNELGILYRDGLDWVLNVDNLRYSSVVVPDEMYDNFQDINWLREQRKKLGLIQGRIKDEDFRRRQQARRKKRRAYAKEQEAKRLAKPPEELPLADVIFYEEESKQE